MLKRVRGGEAQEATRILVVWGTVLSSTPSLLDRFVPNHDSNTLRLNDRSSRKLTALHQSDQKGLRTLLEDWSGRPSLLPGTGRDAGLSAGTSRASQPRLPVRPPIQHPSSTSRHLTRLSRHPPTASCHVPPFPLGPSTCRRPPSSAPSPAFDRPPAISLLSFDKARQLGLIRFRRFTSEERALLNLLPLVDPLSRVVMLVSPALTGPFSLRLPGPRSLLSPHSKRSFLSLRGLGTGMIIGFAIAAGRDYWNLRIDHQADAAPTEQSTPPTPR